MSTDTFPESLRQRMRWAIRESFVIAGIFLLWAGIGLLVLIALGIIAFLIESFEIGQLRFVYGLVRRDSIVWAAVTPLASATIGLYVFVRAGTILIDRYHSINR